MTGSRVLVRHTVALCATALAICLIGVPHPLSAQTRALTAATQSSTDRGVTIMVTPESIGPAAGRWEFAIEMHTHSSGISDDLTQSAVLVTDDGRILKPLAWSDQSLGPHRKGVLSFEVPAPVPRAFELRITREGEPAARTFRWEL